MEFAPVLPAEFYPKLDTGRYHLVQAHLIQNNKRMHDLCDHWRREGHTIILDNGACELGEADIGALANVANIIKPSIVVAPDSFGDRDKTYVNFATASKSMLDLAPGVMAVPHGIDVRDSVECFKSMVEHWRTRGYRPSRLYIGAPKVLDTYQNGGRSIFVWELIHRQWWPATRIHLLGINENLYELPDHPGLMGVDSTLPCALGLNDTELMDDSHKRIISKQQWKLTWAELSMEQRKCIKQNITFCRRYVDGA